MSTNSACPRCAFKLSPNGHICRTCGYVVPSSKKEHSSAEQPPTQIIGEKKGWDNVFGFGAQPEKRRDEPALGET